MTKIINLLIVLCMATYIINAQDDNAVFKAAEQELTRSFKELATQEMPPYFISYTITDKKTTNISAGNGLIDVCNVQENRIFDLDLRTGNYTFDNSHIIRGNDGSMSYLQLSELPMTNDIIVLRNHIWIQTDRAYKAAIERYEKARSNKAVKVAEEDSSADFSNEKPSTYFGEVKQINIDTALWAKRLKRISAKFNAYPDIYNSSLSLNGYIQHRIYINTEGSKISTYATGVRIMVSANTKAEDGMTLPLFKDWFAYDQNGLPDDSEIEKAVDDMIKLLIALKSAPLATTYSGPCILTGEAAGVFFHEIFGHRVEGHRQKDPNSAQTFKQSIGQKILPDFINVYFDPSKKTLAGHDLHGYYQYDDEGILGQKVATVENGKFLGFLMNRCPIDGFPISNGHGRKAPGYGVVTRQSNLIVEATKSIPVKTLRDSLRNEARRQGKEYGLIFEQVSGGFTFTGRQVPNSFNVTPLVVYKVYTDGRPDELVRGVDLIGTPLSTFANVIAAGDDYGVFNGVCGAESGPVPVSASSPSLLVSKIEVQKKMKSQAKLPLLPPPSVGKNP